ncbi:hypothetical protein FRC11_013172, partial [Ceratobasidium sp. 423]
VFTCDDFDPPNPMELTNSHIVPPAIMPTLSKSMYGLDSIAHDDHNEGDEHTMVDHNPQPPAGGSEPLTPGAVTLSIDLDNLGINGGSTVTQTRVGVIQSEFIGVDTSATVPPLRTTGACFSDTAPRTTTFNPEKGPTVEAQYTTYRYRV